MAATTNQMTGFILASVSKLVGGAACGMAAPAAPLRFPARYACTRLPAAM